MPLEKKRGMSLSLQLPRISQHEHKSGANAFGFGGNGGDPSIYLGPNFRLCAIIVTGHGVSDMQLKRMQQPLEVKRAIENNLHQS